MKSGFLTGLVLVSLSSPVLADKHGLPAGAPPAFQAECGSCHVAYPPQFLPADDWRRVMAGLDTHFGDNASLDAPTRHLIEDYLVRNAGSPAKLGRSNTSRQSELPRLTQTVWFQRKHREVSRSDWAHPKVKTPGNCAACHTQAAQGSFREREIVMPGGRRWED